MLSYKLMVVKIQHFSKSNQCIYRNDFLKIPALAGVAKDPALVDEKDFKAEVCIDQSLYLVFFLNFMFYKEFTTIHNISVCLCL
jgi:hypothetical protein